MGGGREVGVAIGTHFWHQRITTKSIWIFFQKGSTTAAVYERVLVTHRQRHNEKESRKSTYRMGRVKGRRERVDYYNPDATTTTAVRSHEGNCKKQQKRRLLSR